jgi:hypothetical protein
MKASERYKYWYWNVVGTEGNYLYGKYTNKDDSFNLLPENFTNTYVNRQSFIIYCLFEIFKLMLHVTYYS